MASVASVLVAETRCNLKGGPPLVVPQEPRRAAEEERSNDARISTRRCNVHGAHAVGAPPRVEIDPRALPDEGGNDGIVRHSACTGNGRVADTRYRTVVDQHANTFHRIYSI